MRQILISALALLGLALIHAEAHTTFPSVADIEASFHFYPGSQLPRDVQGPTGAIFHTYYQSGKELGGGYYSVIVKLDTK